MIVLKSGVSINIYTTASANKKDQHEIGWKKSKPP